MLIIRNFSMAVLFVWISLLGYADSNPEYVLNNILNGTLNSIESDTRLEVENARRLIRQFDDQAIYSKDGDIIKKKSHDGSLESYRYSSEKSLVSVWVTSADGKMREERTYFNGKLKSIIYADGTLKTVHYEMAKDTFCLAENNYYQIFVYSGENVRLFQYDNEGKLAGAFFQDGRQVSFGNMKDFYHISSLISPELLKLADVK